ncbi:MAG: hypothetical protein C5B54_00090 [Acidobacteria bacterium]|nr:MAG: hypothetical protein C5B54_00090 [Acidobacteriota bacterium]
MRSRCRNPNDPNFEYYGGRGIKVCKRWDTSFERLFADMGEPPPNPPGKKRYWSIERRNNDGDYTPSNCYWGTPNQQNSNQRKPKHRPWISTAMKKHWRDPKWRARQVAALKRASVK